MAAILADESKRVAGDIEWREPTPGASYVKFRVAIESSEGVPLAIVGTYNRDDPKLSLSLVHAEVRGRIYGLDVGGAHREGGKLLEATHKHRWHEDGMVVFEPDDISASPDAPLLAWKEFCLEANIKHEGRMNPPPERQTSIW